MAFCLFLFMIPMRLSTGKSSDPPQKQELQELLKHLNKPVVKSIKTAPSFYPEGRSFDEIKSSNAEPIIQTWHLNGRCPKATIPIRRTTEEDILRASSVRSYGRKKHLGVRQVNSVNPETNPSTNHEYAVAYVGRDKYYGATAKFNLWKPQVNQNEFSVVQMWILGFDEVEDMNTIEAGWQVYPGLYGDSNPRFFIYWTSDYYKSTGCYNLLCSGFVQLSNEMALGGALSPVSSYGGAQFDIDILVWKNPNDGNWWMQVGNKYVLGYWPASLFNHLAESAAMIHWGGEIVNLKANGQHTTTQMGGGHFPEEGPGKASFIRNLRVVDASNVLWPPKDLDLSPQSPNCYHIQTDKSKDWGTYFYFGGPGRNPKCP